MNEVPTHILDLGKAYYDADATYTAQGMANVPSDPVERVKLDFARRQALVILCSAKAAYERALDMWAKSTADVEAKADLTAPVLSVAAE